MGQVVMVATTTVDRSGSSDYDNNDNDNSDDGVCLLFA